MSHCLTSQIALTMPNAETIFFIPYFESPRSSCPSTHLLTGSFLRAEAGSLVLAHSSLHFTKYPFSAMREEKLRSNFPTEECASLHMPHREQRTGGKMHTYWRSSQLPKSKTMGSIHEQQEFIITSAKEVFPSFCPCTACFKIKNRFFLDENSYLKWVLIFWRFIKYLLNHPFFTV